MKNQVNGKQCGHSDDVCPKTLATQDNSDQKFVSETRYISDKSFE